jgi:hypothetical protein
MCKIDAGLFYIRAVLKRYSGNRCSDSRLPNIYSQVGTPVTRVVGCSSMKTEVFTYLSEMPKSCRIAESQAL